MFAVMDVMEQAASRTYRLVLDRYPKNAKLLRSYGRFLENVKNDPWTAAKYYAEAEKQVLTLPGLSRPRLVSNSSWSTAIYQVPGGGCPLTTPHLPVASITGGAGGCSTTRDWTRS